MGKGKAIPAWAYKAAIVVATIIWGYSFVAMKDVVSVLPPAWLLGFRFTFAGVLLTAILWKRVHKAFSGRMLLAGAALGLADFMAFWTQTIGLEHTTPGINAFLTATYCVIVPFLWWIVAHRRPTVFNIGAAVLALVGIWLVSVQSGGMTMGYGEAMTLLCALLFAVHMVLVSKLSRFHDVLALTAVQFVAEGCLGFVFGAAFETFPGFGVFTPGIIGQLVFLALFASIVAFGIQNVALAHIPPAQASLFLSLESVFGVLFSIALYGEQITLRLLVGFVLIFAAIVISETFPIKKKTGAQTGETTD